MTWKAADIDKLKKSGKIRGFKSGNKVAKKLPAKKSAALTWLDRELKAWADQHDFELKKEFRFHPVRKFRFDNAIVNIKCAIEYEGGIFMRTSGHNTAIHYTKDCEKYTLATICGWKVLRYTAMNYKNCIKDLNELIKL